MASKVTCHAGMYIPKCTLNVKPILFSRAVTHTSATAKIIHGIYVQDNDYIVVPGSIWF